MKKYTVGVLGELFGLSRSTLLYYDSIGLLKPSGYSEAGYRQYSEADRERLSRIMALRETGLPLERIRTYLDSPAEGPTAMLLERVFEINRQIQDLKARQATLLDFLEEDGSLKNVKDILHTLTSLGEKAGIRSDNSRELHKLFEGASPDLHRRFLRYLGFSEADIAEFLRQLDTSA